MGAVIRLVLGLVGGEEPGPDNSNGLLISPGFFLEISPGFFLKIG